MARPDDGKLVVPEFRLWMLDIGRPLSPAELADFFGSTPGTLRNWRYFGRGPEPGHVEGLIRYHPDAVRRYLREECGWAA